MVSEIDLVPIIVLPIMFVFGLTGFICACTYTRRIRRNLARQREIENQLHPDSQRNDYSPVYQPQRTDYNPVYQPHPILLSGPSSQSNQPNPSKNIYQPNPYVESYQGYKF